MNREKFIQTASTLMEKQGYHATGLKEILEKSGAPKGSLYYYFPDGKEQLASEVVMRAGQTVATRIREKTQDRSDAGKAICDFLYMVAKRVEETNFYTGSTLNGSDGIGYPVGTYQSGLPGSLQVDVCGI